MNSNKFTYYYYYYLSETPDSVAQDSECPLCAIALGSLLVLLSHSNKGRLILFSLYLRSGPEYYLLRCRQMATDDMGFSVSTMQSKGPCDLDQVFTMVWFF